MTTLIKKVLLTLLCASLLCSLTFPATQTAEAKSLVLPSSYYLTNDGYVTSVKLQSPWGSCWAFAITSAIESSILKAETNYLNLAQKANSSKGMEAPVLTGLNDSIDLSERAIAWLSHEPQTEDTAGAQAGEGYHLVNPSDPMSQLPEGSFSMVEAALTSWQLLVPEDKAPYEYNGYTGEIPWYSTGSGGTDARYFDWSVDQSLMTSSDIAWRVSNILHLDSPAIMEFNPITNSYDYLGYDDSANISIKQALLDVGAVAISLEAELSIPSQVVRRESTAPSAHFSYDTWAQYNGRAAVSPNHALTIVGWDDTYPASNFHGSESGSPIGDGAWLCKNNWGSDVLYESLGGAADSTHWGIDIESAGATGFFWLSYYDHSICDVTAFEVVKAEDYADNIYQHDYLSTAEFVSPTSYNSEMKVANVFETDACELLDSVSAWTFNKNETVDTEIYIIPDAGEGDTSNLDTPNYFTDQYLVAEFTKTFEDSGFHTIELDNPIMLPQEQRFAVIQRIHGEDPEGTNDAESDEIFYLSLEYAYTQNDPNAPQSAMANVVSNEGETYILLFGNDWAPVSDYNDWYADLKAQGNVAVDVIYGNALIKAYTNNTSISFNNIIYKTVELQ